MTLPRQSVMMSGTTKVAHRDSFGFLTTSLVGVSTWTIRALRGTKVTAPHIARNDVFAYKCQFNHDKKLGVNADGFHLHIIPIGAVAGGEKIHLTYAWGWLTNGDTYPATLPNSNSMDVTLTAGDQYKYMIVPIVSDLTFPAGEGYSSEFFIEITRGDTPNDTYAGEFALLDGDVHYPSKKLGSDYEFNDE